MHRFSRRSAARPAPLLVQQLESRLVPALTYHGGALLHHVDVQNVYLGDGWLGSAFRTSDINKFEAFTKYIVKSPYMDMLAKAGYHVGRGKSEPGIIVGDNLGSSVSNATIQADLQSLITNDANMQQPNKNRLYQVFVAPSVLVTKPGGDSQNNFLAYHSSFHGTNADGKAFTIAYSVMPYQGTGVNAIASLVPLTSFDAITEATTHELAEAATDPLVNESDIKLTGWWDETTGNENGDVVNQQVVLLNGWVVQKEVTPKLVTIVPRGSFDYVVFASGLSSSPAAELVSAFTPADLGYDPSSPFGSPSGIMALTTGAVKDRSPWDTETLYGGR